MLKFKTNKKMLFLIAICCLFSFQAYAAKNQPPTAAIINCATSQFENQSVNYNGMTSSDPEGGPLIYSWDFEDGTTANGDYVSHAFSTAGTYNVTLTVEDDRGATDTDICVVTVAVQNPPVAKIVLTPSTGVVGENVTFDPRQSSYEGNLTSVLWDHGDGTTSQQNTPHPYAYTVAGTYLVSLTITDDANQSDTAYQYISIAPSSNPPNCSPVSGNIEVSMDGDCYRIQSAIDQADGITPLTINVLAGSYLESLTITTDNISLIGAGKETTKIITVPDTIPVSMFAVSNVNISGFTIEDSPNSTITVEGIVVTDSTDVTVESNNLLDTTRKAIKATNSSIVIKGNKISAKALPCDTNVKLSWGVLVDNGGSLSALNVEISGNLIAGYDIMPVDLRAQAIDYTGSAGSMALISGNTIIDTDGGAILVQGSGTAKVLNNSIFRDTEQGIYVNQDDNSEAVVTGNTIIDTQRGANISAANLNNPVTFSHNTISGSIAKGMLMGASGSSTSPLIINDNTILNSGSDGLEIWSGLSTVDSLFINRNIILGSGGVDFKTNSYAATVSANKYGTIDDGLNLVGDSGFYSTCLPR